MSTEQKQVMIVGIDDSKHSFYALQWTLDHFIAPFAPNSPFNLILVHCKPIASSVVGLAGPGAADVLPIVESDLKRTATRAVGKAKELCKSKLDTQLFNPFLVAKSPSMKVMVNGRYQTPNLVTIWLKPPRLELETSPMGAQEGDDVNAEVVEGDARNGLCEAVEKHHASMLVVGSHGYGAIKRAVLGSVSDYVTHHAHCTVIIVKKPETKQ